MSASPRTVHHRSQRTVATATVSVAAGLLLALAVPLSASAHVTISPYSAEPGSYALVTFKVPNESATATTTRLEVDIPTGTPFPDVSYVPVPGWTTHLVTEKLPKPVKFANNELTEAVTKVIWTADATSGITDGQLQLFQISVGPVPDTGSIRLPAIQTYSDGTVSNWDGTTVNAEHPAPVLYVNDSPVASTDADAEVTAQTLASTAPVAPDDIIARILAIGGLVVGAIGIVIAVTTLRRRDAR